jgi:hypothetical protein
MAPTGLNGRAFHGYPQPNPPLHFHIQCRCSPHDVFTCSEALVSFLPPRPVLKATLDIKVFRAKVQIYDGSMGGRRWVLSVSTCIAEGKPSCRHFNRETFDGNSNTIVHHFSPPFTGCDT